MPNPYTLWGCPVRAEPEVERLIAGSKSDACSIGGRDIEPNPINARRLAEAQRQASGPARLVSVRDVAAAAGWKYLRMLRHLKKQDEELGGRLLRKTGSGNLARYSLTMAALEQVNPQWFARVATVATRVDAIEDRLDGQDSLIVEALKTIRDLMRANGSLVSRIEVLERRKGP